MPAISQKGQRMPASPIRKLVPFAEAAKKRGIQVLHLNIGQPDIRTPQVALDAIKGFRPTVVEYSHSAGNESYRKGLAAYYGEHGIGITHEDIIITTGGSEALLFGMMACFDPGDEIIIPEPFYANYNSFAVSAGIAVVPVRSGIDTGFALPPIEAFRAAITPRTRGILLCNPGNPTGYLYSRAELEALRDLVAQHDLYLFSDEVYREFCYDGTAHVSAMTLKGIEDNVVMIDSVSKRYSMCGARIGAFVAELRAAGFAIDRVDLGGGLGVPYQRGQVPPEPAEYGQMVARVTKGWDVTLMFEPGRVIVGNAGVLLTKVIWVKPGVINPYVIVDAAMNDLARPALYDAWHDFEAVRPNGARMIANIAGPVCESTDTFAMARDIDAVKPGDLAVFRTAGAYGATMASTYNSRALVPEVMVDGDRYAVVADRVQPEALIAAERLPEWLLD